MRPIGEALVRCKVNLSTVALGTMPMKITVALVEVDQRTRRPTVPRDTPFKTRGRMSSGGGATLYKDRHTMANRMLLTGRLPPVTPTGMGFMQVQVRD